MVTKIRSRGYTLIEVLVAMIILSLTLTTIFRIFSGGLLKIGIASDYTQAVVVAESVLAATGNTEKLIAGETGGRALEKYRWSRSVTPYQLGDRVPQSGVSVYAYKVSIIVKWPVRDGFRSVDLSTLKLANNFHTGARK